MKLKTSQILRGLLLCSFPLVAPACSNNADFQEAAPATEIPEPESASAGYSGEGDATTQKSIGSKIESTDLEVKPALERSPDQIVQGFSPVKIEAGQMKVTLKPGEASLSLTLTDSHQDQRDDFTQIVRTALTQTKKQGQPGQAVAETFDQKATKGLADILVVVDNSGSMSQEQTNLATKLNELLVSIGTANWQVGVITTSPLIQSGVEKCQLSLIKYNDTDPMGRFKTAVQVGTSGSGNEQGVRQAVVGLNCTETPWVRPNSTLAVLIVSDEDNCSKDGADCGTSGWAKENYLIDHIEKKMGREIGKTAGIYGIFSHPTKPCSTAGNLGTQYARLVNYKAQGAVNWGDICDASYKTTLNRISDSIAVLIQNQFELKAKPDTGSAKVSFLLKSGATQTVPSSAYTINDRTITFVAGQEPPVDSKIQINYTTGAVPMFSAITLDQDPAPGTLGISINGAMVAPSGYSVAGRTITFVSQPPAMSDVKADYRLNVPLQSRFKISQVPLNGQVAVTVDGQSATGYSFETATRDLVFVTPPLDGKPIAATYKYRVGPQLQYHPAVAIGAFNLTLFDGSKSVPFTFANGVLSIAPDLHTAGKVLTLRYELPENAPRSFPLGQVPLQDGLQLTSTDPKCALDSGMEIKVDTLYVECPTNQAFVIDLRFKYETLRQTFLFAGVDTPDKGAWTVRVNGESISDYSRTGLSFTIERVLSRTDRVDIAYTFPD